MFHLLVRNSGSLRTCGLVEAASKVVCRNGALVIDSDQGMRKLLE